MTLPTHSEHFVTLHLLLLFFSKVDYDATHVTCIALDCAQEWLKNEELPLIKFLEITIVSLLQGNFIF
jgi:hypothetical protein